MPPLGLICGALIIKAFALWLKMQEDPSKILPAEKEAAAEVTNQPSRHQEKVCYLL